MNGCRIKENHVFFFNCFSIFFQFASLANFFCLFQWKVVYSHPSDEAICMQSFCFAMKTTCVTSVHQVIQGARDMLHWLNDR